jgi:hypothetical protein
LGLSAATTTPSGTDGKLAGAAIAGAPTRATLKIATRTAVNKVRTKTSKRVAD